MMIKNLLYISIITIIITVVVIASSIYHNQITSTISQETTGRIIPIAPTFDQQTISSLLKRKELEVDLNAGGAFSSPSARVFENSSGTNATSSSF